MATEKLIPHLREKGETLRPETLMILLRAANTDADEDRIGAIQRALLGTPTEDGEIIGGPATKRIERLARRCGYYDYHEIADFRSECYKGMVRHLNALNGPPTLWEGNFSIAIAGIAKDVRDSLRAKRNAELRAQTDVDLHVPDDALTDLLTLKWDNEALYAALQLLPANQREAVQRHAIDGETFVEIAAGCDVTPDAIRHRYTQGMQRLRADTELVRQVSYANEGEE